MGNFQSTKTREFISKVTDIVNEVCTKVANDSLATCEAVNVFGGIISPPPGCVLSGVTVNIEQTAKSMCSLDSVANTKITQEIATELKEKLDQLIKTEVQNKQSFLATGLSIQITDTEVQQQILDSITNRITQDIKNGCKAVSEAWNRGELAIYGCFKDTTIQVRQNATAEALTNCVMETIATTAVGNQTLAQIVQEADTKLASEQQGLSSVLWIILLIVGALLILGIIIFFLTRGGDTQVAILQQGLDVLA